MWNIVFSLAGITIVILGGVAVLAKIRIKKLRVYNSALLGKIDVWQKFDGERMLNINDYPQGISIEKKSVESSYWYTVAKMTVDRCSGIAEPRILMLGLGANTIPRLIDRLRAGLDQTVVEIDECIIAACREFFGLDTLKSVDVVHDDIFRLISDPVSEKYKNSFDVIIIDIFTGASPFVSPESTESAFIMKLVHWLRGDGVLIFNRPTSNVYEMHTYHELVAFLQSVFENVESRKVLDPRGYRNTLVVANHLK